MTLDELNRCSETDFVAAVEKCCGARGWVGAMLRARPFANEAALLAAAEQAADQMGREDWLEAFSHHPRIGDVESLARKFASTAAWASREQGGAAQATPQTLADLHRLNGNYEARHGFIFIVFATGKSADEMLAILRRRIDNSTDDEIRNAAGEQRRITRLRLQKLLGVAP